MSVQPRLSTRFSTTLTLALLIAFVPVAGGVRPSAIFVDAPHCLLSELSYAQAVGRTGDKSPVAPLSP